MDWCIGHDDTLSLQVNEDPVRVLDGTMGFQSSTFKVPLKSGWNRIVIALENHENVNWRWPGFSLSMRAAASRQASLQWGEGPE